MSNQDRRDSRGSMNRFTDDRPIPLLASRGTFAFEPLKRESLAMEKLSTRFFRSVSIVLFNFCSRCGPLFPPPSLPRRRCPMQSRRAVVAPRRRKTRRKPWLRVLPKERSGSWTRGHESRVFFTRQITRNRSEMSATRETPVIIVQPRSALMARNARRISVSDGFCAGYGIARSSTIIVDPLPVLGKRRSRVERNYIRTFFQERHGKNGSLAGLLFAEFRFGKRNRALPNRT